MNWSSAHRALAFCIVVVLVMRVWFGFLGALVIITQGAPIVPNPPTMYHGLARVADEGMGLLLAPWQRWDAIWYLRIAEFGYASDDASGAFFPLFPILTRAVALVTQNYLIAALIVSTLATITAFTLLYRLCAELFGESAPRRAVIYWAIFPTSFFLLAPYAESVLAASALAALYFARRRQWALAAIGAAGATLARPVGFFIALPMAVEAWRTGSSPRERASAYLPLVAVPGAMGAWMLYLHIEFGDALRWIHAEANWERIWVLPGQTLVWTIQTILGGENALANNLTDLTLTLIVLAALGAGATRLPLSFSLYAFAMILVPLLSYAQAGTYSLAPMAAAGRRALVVFPAFIALGLLWKGRWREPLWLGISGGVQALLFIMFVRWLWID